MFCTFPAKDPTLSNAYSPDWWNIHGYKPALTESGSPRIICIESRVAHLEIRRSGSAGWRVMWKLVHWVDGDVDTGQRIMSNEELSAAFGLSALSGEHSEWLIATYGATVAYQGSYIRWRNHLNIPGPGTGHDGNPNISIYLTEDIKEAVRNLIASYPTG